MPRKPQLATRIRRIASSVGLLQPAFVTWRAVREFSPKVILNNRRLRHRKSGRVRVPPGHLIFSATGSRDVSWFLNSGEATAQSFQDALLSIGRPIESFSDIFEWGCGCGRVLRQWAAVEGPRFFASDYNPAGIEWGREHLPFVSLSTNQLSPPLPYADSSFDLCYAVSVFTHLPEHLQRPWLEELARVTRPGGILLVTLSGEGDLLRLTLHEQERFYSGQLVVLDAAFAGTNLCGVYHPQSYVRERWNDLFEVILFLPEGAKGSPYQDLYVLRRM